MNDELKIIILLLTIVLLSMVIYVLYLLSLEYKMFGKIGSSTSGSWKVYQIFHNDSKHEKNVTPKDQPPKKSLKKSIYFITDVNLYKKLTKPTPKTNKGETKKSSTFTSSSSTSFNPKNTKKGFIIKKPERKIVLFYPKKYIPSKSRTKSKKNKFGTGDDRFYDENDEYCFSLNIKKIISKTQEFQNSQKRSVGQSFSFLGKNI